MSARLHRWRGFFRKPRISASLSEEKDGNRSDRRDADDGESPGDQDRSDCSVCSFQFGFCFIRGCEEFDRRTESHAPLGVARIQS